MTHHLELDTLTLSSGAHGDREASVCLLEAVAWWAEEPHSDRPDCVCPTLAAFGRAWNDGMRSDAERAQLVRYVPVLPGTAGTDADASRRAWLALDWSVRVSTPAWLDLAGLSVQAAKLRALPEQTERDDDVTALLREVRDDARAARDAAWDAAWAAAWDAAGDAALAAAWDAAWAAAWAAARDAARDAAWDAAWDAARDAAWDAAWDAAGDAALAAAWDAAWAAAGNALEPTVTTLQASAHGLYVAMIAAGPHDPDLLAQVTP